MSVWWILAFLLLWLVVVVLVLLVVGLLRRIAPILERAEALLQQTVGSSSGLPPGSLVPSYVLDLDEGNTLTEADLHERPYVLLFVSSGCAPCAKLVTEVGEAADAELNADLILVANQADVLDLPTSSQITVARQVDGSVSRAFQTSATPHAFAVDAGGVVVATAFPNTLVQLRELARQAQRGGAPQRNNRKVVPA